MHRALKLVIALVPLVSWSCILWYYIVFPELIPDFLKQPGFKKLLMLDHDGHSGFFSILFAVTFSAISIAGVAGLLTNRFGKGWADD